MPGVLIRKYSLNDEGDEFVLWGEIDPASLEELLIDTYQREVLPVTKIEDWKKSYAKGAVPEWDLGMRGDSFECLSDEELILNDPVFIVDGQQRREAAYAVMKLGGKVIIRVTVRFNSTAEVERARFALLNNNRVKVSANIVVANLRFQLKFIDELYRLTGGDGNEGDPSCMLAGRVTWKQRRNKSDFISSVTLVRLADELHRHLGYAGVTPSAQEAARNIDMVAEGLGYDVVIANLQTFFAALESKWELTKLENPGNSRACNASFLIGLARVLSAHSDFWSQDQRTLVIAKADMGRLHRYPVLDDSTRGLSNEASFVRDISSHFNKGRETRGGGMKPWAVSAS
ncbi:MAG TPA: hypothetical protein VFZ48_01030 [Candidatus Saccharimonadales bacterium]